ncbi:D-serine deaminase, pyridoxal phosphate-dependent [Mariniphaga anaerophila]|uniref:D-serine deaminase, pyridoxal phosphate-dependent n=1 Tax=Mariniphaga anaerophila TaxID=1484053 RepID=A0A1M5FY84_9BACT|nr:alanine racemase [Mariniphaga anaerophila]SHF96458.1 D-serine deaminase, pyridoxal phosphate-dependent [Mariniphaga anaerophila]
MVEIIRPTLVINKDVCLQNIEKMAQKAKSHKLRFRPHFKTHQSAKIGDWFRIFGVDAITVSSVQMAEYFARNGWNDITIAFPLNILEIGNINRLAANIKLNVLIENREAATALSKRATNPVGVFFKIDTGATRTGIDPSKTGTINSILEILSNNKKITFKGFLTHAGHTYSALSTNEIFSRHFDALLKLKNLKKKYQSRFPDIEVSIGDTPSCTLCTNFNGVDEIRPGNFVFYDLMQYNLGVCSLDDIAVRMVCPVVAKHPSRSEIVIYGGAIHFSRESLINVDGKPFFGRIYIRNNGEEKLLSERNYLSKLSQEHGIIKVSQKSFNLIQIGDLVEVVPIHSCLTANLARKYLTTEGEEIPMINT